jgi:hypothetical protein
MINHLAAIAKGEVDKSNVTGIRKALNATARRLSGLSVSRTAAKVDGFELVEAVHANRPRVVGELHDSGIKLLRDRRYAKRFTYGQRDVIDNLSHFRLVDFEEVGRYYFVPVFAVYHPDGRSFRFYNVPWQSGGNGPTIVS